MVRRQQKALLATERTRFLDQRFVQEAIARRAGCGLDALRWLLTLPAKHTARKPRSVGLRYNPGRIIRRVRA